MNYTIKYFEKGKEEEKLVNIKFFSNCNRERYNEIATGAFEAKEKWDRMSDIDSLITAKTRIMVGKSKDEKAEIKEEIEQLKDEYKSCVIGLKMFEKTGLLKNRFNLIKDILEDNGIEDSDMFDYEWWDKKVDPKETMLFLSSVALEDIKDVKKNWTM